MGVDEHRLRYFFPGATILILAQLILGATMRHQHAGLAIPDFPAAYHKIWPDTDAASIVKYNQLRINGEGYQPITAFQVVLQMVHRLMALAVLLAVGISAWLSRRHLGSSNILSRLSLGWLLLIGVQVFLGAATIWTGKKADIATAHVACGALILMTGGLSSILCYRLLAPAVVKNSNADEMETRAAAAKKIKLTTLQPSSSIH
jgi:cytochrome c oxidase assembly protein subunit 15